MPEHEKDRWFAIRLMEHLVVPTFVLDPEGHVIIWNKACERLSNVKAEEVIGTKDHWKAFYEEKRVCLADLVREGRNEEVAALYSSHCVTNSVYDGVRAENWCVMPRAATRLYLAINCGPILDENGDVIAIVETLRDMTEQKRAEEALESLAHKDGLTGLANRRSFDKTLESALLHAQRHKEPLTLLLADVDHFKPYNDTYGHQRGDECLKKVAGAIGKQAMRARDLAARYGGEEFAMIVPEANYDGARRVAERIRQAVFDLNAEHKTSQTADRVTLSVGAVALIPDETTTAEELIQMADEMLYAAKQNGRNQVRCCSTKEQLIAAS